MTSPRKLTRTRRRSLVIARALWLTVNTTLAVFGVLFAYDLWAERLQPPLPRWWYFLRMTSVILVFYFSILMPVVGGFSLELRNVRRPDANR